MRLIKYLLIFSLFLFSCKKENKPDNKPVNELSKGILVLNEGLFQMNNSTLSWINISDLSVNNQFFSQKTGRNLGDTGNDLKRYGNKIYIVVTSSNTVEVLDATTGNSIKQISFLNGNLQKQPRNICFYKNKAFVSCFDGYVDVIDTTNLLIEQRISVGLNPDYLISNAQKLVVSNSGGLNSPQLDSTLSIINLTDYSETKLLVGKNPGDLEIINDFLFVLVRGNYASIPSSIVKVDMNSSQVIENFSIRASSIEKMKENLLVVYTENQEQKLGIFNAISGTWINSSIVDLNEIQTLYKVIYNEKNDRIYLLDAQGYTNLGKVIEYTSTGQKLNEFKVGLNPNSLLFFD